MQHPTLTNVRIRSTRDALRIFTGVARQVLPLITRRLDAEERRAIVPGNVYVWEERGANTEVTGLGMERWTDGMGWGPSRVRDEFLFYHQKESEYTEDSTIPLTPWAQMISLYPIPRARATSDAERLIKQTYSVRVSLPADRARGITRKWHITAYFSQQKLDSLDPVDNIPGVGDVPIPEGWFESARATKNRRVASTSSKAQRSAENVDAPIDVPIASTSYFPARPTSYPSQSPYEPPELTSPTYPFSHDRNTSREFSFTPPLIVPSQHYPSFSPRGPSSGSSSPYDRSPSASPPVPSTPSPSITPARLDGKLVPLEFLRNISYPRRDPIDEQLLSRFSTQIISSAYAPDTQRSPYSTEQGLRC